MNQNKNFTLTNKAGEVTVASGENHCLGVIEKMENMEEGTIERRDGHLLYPGVVKFKLSISQEVPKHHYVSKLGAAYALGTHLFDRHLRPCGSTYFKDGDEGRMFYRFEYERVSVLKKVSSNEPEMMSIEDFERHIRTKRQIRKQKREASQAKTVQAKKESLKGADIKANRAKLIEEQKMVSTVLSDLFDLGFEDGSPEVEAERQNLLDIGKELTELSNIS